MKFPSYQLPVISYQLDRVAHKFTSRYEFLLVLRAQVLTICVETGGHKNKKENVLGGFGAPKNTENVSTQQRVYPGIKKLQKILLEGRSERATVLLAIVRVRGAEADRTGSNLSSSTRVGHIFIKNS